MDTKQIESKLRSIESLGEGSVDANIVFVDEWWEKSINQYRDPSYKLFLEYLKRSQLNLDKVYTTCAEKRWMHSEDEWHEALALELSLIRPRMVVSLGNRKVKKILYKIKDMIPDFRWFHEIHNHHVIKRFFHDDSFYIEELNQLAKDFQYDKEVEEDLHLKTLAFLPQK